MRGAAPQASGRAAAAPQPARERAKATAILSDHGYGTLQIRACLEWCLDPWARNLVFSGGVMRVRRLALLAMPCAVLAFASGAEAQQRNAHRADPQAAMVDKLNQESLDRARAGQNTPVQNLGPDTTQNLNRLSDDAARQGRAVNQAPLPFR